MSRRIDDHSFWAGSRSKGSIFPEGAKTQMHDSDGGEGRMMDYPDTDPRIREQQNDNEKKMASHKLKVPYRN